ncbi:MAG: DMT family transporter [Clostridia bacterium]|nr:DMT family transporter [Clostridia bacterium]
MSENRKGALFVALAAISWSFAGVLCKYLPWSSLTLNGFRNLVATILLIISRGTWKVKLSKGNCLGALGVMGTSLTFMLSTKITSAANAIVIQYAMPVFVVLFCWLFYKQVPTKGNIITVLVILFGVFLCSAEGMGNGAIVGDLLALVSAVTFALVFFCSKLPDTDAQSYSYLGLILGIPFSLAAFWDPNFVIAPQYVLSVVGMGFALAFGYIFIAKGLSRTSPLTAAILANIEPVLNPVWVFLFLGDAPGVLTIVGAAIVLITATIYSVKSK